ncbi:hypothetical protein ACP4OV_026628 [Aristida adscensionis]
MAEPDPEPPRKRQPVYTVDQLLHAVEAAGPDANLSFEIASNLSLQDARKLWEAVSIEGGHGELGNLEVLWGKAEAADFVDEKIRELEAWREALNGQIGCINSWCLQMQRRLDSGGPSIPLNYAPLTFLGGPQLYLNLAQFGAVDGEANREEILDMFFKMTVPPQTWVDDGSYGSRASSRKREHQDRRSILSLNIRYLKIKRNGLVALKKHIDKGIRDMRRVFKERMHMGSGNTDFSAFRDIEMVHHHDEGSDEDM